AITNGSAVLTGATLSGDLTLDQNDANSPSIELYNGAGDLGNIHVNGDGELYLAGDFGTTLDGTLLHDVGTGTADTDAVNKGQMDTAIAAGGGGGGISWPVDSIQILTTNSHPSVASNVLEIYIMEDRKYEVYNDGANITTNYTQF
ncbi:unnamed protein product, partial [marine sediment metagenome]